MYSTPSAQILVLVFLTSNLSRITDFVFSVYRCHGNIDFPQKYIISNFNPSPISGVNFKLIRD